MLQVLGQERNRVSKRKHHSVRFRRALRDVSCRVLTGPMVKKATLFLERAFPCCLLGSADIPFLQSFSRFSPVFRSKSPYPDFRLNNNLDMLNNRHMDPATEQVLVQARNPDEDGEK